MATTPNTNPSPKTRFQANPQNITEHRAMMELPAFDRGIDFALLQYQLQLTGGTFDGNGAARTGLSMLGAQEFVQVLKTLSEKAPPPPTTAVPQLRHDV